MAFRHVSWAEVYKRMECAPPGRLYGTSRSGAVVAGLSGRAADRLEDADWLVYDVVDSAGGGIEDGKPVWGLLDRARDGIGDDTVLLPWDTLPQLSARERMGRLETVGRDLLTTLGYDTTSDGLRETPARWARWWMEFHECRSARVDTTFEVTTSGQLVVVSDIKVWSLCEHHLLPFSVDMAIGYVPAGRLLGLSKFARIAMRAASRLQVQERMTSEIADAVQTATGTESVAVLAHGRHLCMESRGVRSLANASTVILRGAFETEPGLRLDLYHVAGFPAAPLRMATGPVSRISRSPAATANGEP